MTLGLEVTGTKVCWFVGAAFAGTNDQTSRFIDNGIWQNGYEDRYLDLVKSIEPGDHIAIKSTYTRKNALPFDNRGLTVSVMAIKAIGRVLQNPKDGRTLKVDWGTLESPREWYFYTGRSTVWRVLSGEWEADALIAFAFENQPQDIDAFRNAPFWRERFGDVGLEKRRFAWTRFYEEIANKLLDFRSNRQGLISEIQAIATKIDGVTPLQDRFADGKTGILEDICPFTVMGIFNRGTTDANRKAIALALAEFLGVTDPVPDTFEGIPTLNNHKSWFFHYHNDRKPDDIDVLWEIFSQAIKYADTADTELQNDFVIAFNNASSRKGVGWNLTMGLYWSRPWAFPTLDSQSQKYISKKLAIDIGLNGPKGRCSANDYITLLETLKVRFQEIAYPVHSFPELSLAACNLPTLSNDRQSPWHRAVLNRICELCNEKGSAEFSRKEYQDKFLDSFKEEFPENNTIEFSIDRNMQLLRDEEQIEFLERGCYRWLGFGEPDANITRNDQTEVVTTAPTLAIYSLEHIISDGCFVPLEKLETILERIRTKKNLILQGPPGTGKTWLAKRISFALMGQRNEGNVRSVQFHPNLSYEDFVRGWRPSGDGKLSLVDGPLLEIIKAAGKDPKSKYVIVIEEINRGNPAQILGEMLTLLEVDKRTPNEALELCYRRCDDEQVFVPDNLYVIGTMNIADRSLALVDFALRRRFAFVDLEPVFGKAWQDWVHTKCGIDRELLAQIEFNVKALNLEIANSAILGPQFQIGHSFVTPPYSLTIHDPIEWFRQVVLTEIGPLLDEYWFDVPGKAEEARQLLLKGF